MARTMGKMQTTNSGCLLIDSANVGVNEVKTTINYIPHSKRVRHKEIAQGSAVATFFRICPDNTRPRGVLKFIVRYCFEMKCKVVQ